MWETIGNCFYKDKQNLITWNHLTPLCHHHVQHTDTMNLDKWTLVTATRHLREFDQVRLILFYLGQSCGRQVLSNECIEAHWLIESWISTTVLRKYPTKATLNYQRTNETEILRMDENHTRQLKTGRQMTWWWRLREQKQSKDGECETIDRLSLRFLHDSDGSQQYAKERRWDQWRTRLLCRRWCRIQTVSSACFYCWWVGGSGRCGVGRELVSPPQLQFSRNKLKLK